MKILHLIGTIDPTHGGSVESVVQGATVWARLGHEAVIVCADGPNDPWVRSCPVTVQALGRGRDGSLMTRLPWLRYSYSSELVPWLRANRHRYDAIVVNGLWNYAAFAARRAICGSSTPY